VVNNLVKNVKGYIKRKSMLYVTGVEYGDYTMNHVQGCSHGCTYPCYAFMMKKRFGQVSSYEEWLEPYLVENTLDLLDKEIPRLKHKIKSVQLCFSTDPFMFNYPEIVNLSIQSIKKLNSYNIKCIVLTKGLLPIELETLSKKNEYGITIISLDENFLKNTEPFSAPILDRIKALRDLHNKGCKTWVSIEPYPTPNFIDQNINDILSKISFVDRIVFGRLNYNKKVRDFKNYKQFYNEQSRIVEEFCNKNNISLHIKEGTVTEKNLDL